MMVANSKTRTALPVTIAAHHRLDALGPEWRALQAGAAGTLFESYEWCRTWQETVGKARGVTPRIITGHGGDGRLVFILPFGVSRRAGVELVEWLSAPHLNCGFGLYDTAFLAACGGTLEPYWTEIRALLAPADALHLEVMPPHWRGVAHPLAALFTTRGANATYLVRLTPADAGEATARRSGATRRGARKRDSRLEAAGAVSFGLPDTPQEARAVLRTMFAHQERRLRELGIPSPFDAPVRQFFDRILEPDDGAPSPLAPYRLTLDGEVVATALGGIHDGVFHALVLAMGDGPVRSLSPGDAVLRRTVAACAARGLALLDLAPGHAQYKAVLADETVPLYEALMALSPRGHVHVAAARVRTALKYRIKRSPALWRLARRLRRVRAALMG